MTLIMILPTLAGVMGCGSATSSDRANQTRMPAGSDKPAVADKPDASPPGVVVDDAAVAKDGETITSVAEPVFVEAETIADRYKNGNRRREYVQHVYLNAPPVWHGPFKEWHENGQLQKEGEYREGKKVGPWQWWSETGTLMKEGRYSPHAELDGVWNFFRLDGTAERIESFSKGQKDGAWIWYDASGRQAVVREHFRAGQRNGLSQRWYPPKRNDETHAPEQSLVLQRKVPYVDGREHGDAIEYFPSGKKKVLMPYRNGRRHGTAVEWNEAGDVITENTYRDGERHD